MHFNALKGVKTENWQEGGEKGPESRKWSNNSWNQTHNDFPLKTL